MWYSVGVLITYNIISNLGAWELSLVYDNEVQPVSHQVEVFDVRQVRVTGLENARLEVNRQHVFQVDCSKAGVGQLVPALYYNDLTSLPIEMNEIRGKLKVYNLQFIPIGPGQYTVDLLYSKEQIPSIFMVALSIVFSFFQPYMYLSSCFNCQCGEIQIEILSISIHLYSQCPTDKESGNETTIL